MPLWYFTWHQDQINGEDFSSWSMAKMISKLLDWHENCVSLSINIFDSLEAITCSINYYILNVVFEVDVLNYENGVNNN